MEIKSDFWRKSMDARKGNIYEILNGNRQFLIPVYQRYYSWDVEQCKRLWNDIVEMQKRGKEGHFVGSIVNIAEQAMPTGVQKYMIIDGQQRITTLSLLLIALRDYAVKNPGDTTINARRIDNMLLKNEYEIGDERYKLLLTETDRDILKCLVEEKPISDDTRSKLLDNYRFFASKIADKELLPAEIYESIGKLQIVNITLDRLVDDAQAIFESLNSTGKELSESDLIRNYVLMGLEPAEQTYVYEHLWRPMELLFVYETQGLVMDKFFRDYLTMKTTRIPKQNRIYEEFKLYHLNCEFGTVRELCQDLFTYVRSDDYVNSIKAFFIMRDDYKEFPNDDKFTAAFVSKDIYTMRSRNFILSHLENYGNKAPIIIENYTIEHIMPQNSNLSPEWQKMLGTNWRDVQKTYLHTIGNLTLTAYNSEMSDHPFMVKMDMEGGFKESALRLNAYVVKVTEWNEQRIKERARLLADKAKQIWAFPDMTVEELAPYQVEEKPAERYNLETYDTNVFTKTLFDVLDRRIRNLSPSVKREFKKLYVAYKLDTNFVDIVFQKQRLRISINMKFSEVIDPKGICRDITGLGRWGNGDVELYMEHTADVDQIMDIVEQSYRVQADEA